MFASKIPILVVGATGQLGALITKHALQKENLLVNILIRNNEKLKDLQDQVRSKGGNVLIGDTTQAETLKNSTKGIHTVVSALIGDDKTVLDGQIALLKDSEANGVKRFLPSDFGLDYRKLSLHDHPLLAQRLRFRRILAKSTVKPIHIFNGAFTETLFYFMSFGRDQNGVYHVQHFESPDTVLDTTTYGDTAKFVSNIISDLEATGDFEIIGQKTSYNNLSQTYAKVKGKPFVLYNQGNLETLIAARDQAVEAGDHQKAIWYGYNIPMFDGRGQLFNPVHEKYGVKTTSVEEYLRSRPDL